MTVTSPSCDPRCPRCRPYHKQLTEKFIRDWGFDGSKLDNIYSVPACYNPAHHHKSPQDSVNAVGKSTKHLPDHRAIKPESVTQICPCGTPPSLAWLPFIDQAVTADPVGAVQVRRRIKMYKALLWAAVRRLRRSRRAFSDDSDWKGQLERAWRRFCLHDRCRRRPGNEVRLA